MTVPEILNNQEIINALSKEFDFDILTDLLDKQGLDISNNQPEQYYILANTEKVQAIKKKYPYPHNQPIIKTKVWNLYMVPPTYKQPYSRMGRPIIYTREQTQNYYNEDLELSTQGLIPFYGYHDKWTDFL